MGPKDPGQRGWVPQVTGTMGLPRVDTQKPCSCLPSAPGASCHGPVMALPQEKEAKGPWRKESTRQSLQAWVITATCKRHSGTRSHSSYQIWLYDKAP